MASLTKAIDGATQSIPLDNINGIVAPVVLKFDGESILIIQTTPTVLGLRGVSGSTPVPHAAGVVGVPNALLPQESSLGLYLPPGWDANYRAALAQIATVPLTVNIMGASMEQGGINSTDIYAKAAWPLWRAMMLARGISLYGDFFPPFYSSLWTPFAAPNGHAIVFDYNTTANILTINVGPLLLTAFNVLNNTGNPLMHYAHPAVSLGYNNLSGDIVYWDPANGASGSWTWNLNGGAAQTVNLLNTGTMKRVSWNSSTPGWVNGANVVNIMTQSANQKALIIGFSAYPFAAGPAGQGGMGFGWMAQTAMALNELGRTDQNAAMYTGVIDKIGLHGGTQLTAYPFSDIGTPAAFGFPFNSKLIIHGWYDDELFYNRMADMYGVQNGGPSGGSYGQGTPSYQGFGCDPLSFRWFLNRLRHVNIASGGSMLYLLAAIPSGSYSDVQPLNMLTMNRHAYIDQYHAAARHLSCGILDDTAILGEKGLSTGDQLSTNAHYTDIGHAKRAIRMAGIL